MQENGAPLPDLYSLSLDGEEANAWARAPQAVIFARRIRYVRPLEGSTLTRSPFRSGMVTVRQEGLDFQGVGVKPSTLFMLYAFLFTLIGTLIALVWAFFKGDLRSVAISFFPSAFFATGFGAMMDQIVTELRPAPMEITICWQDIAQWQVAPNCRYAVLIARDQITQSRAGKEELRTLVFHTVNPAILDSLTLIVDRYAPGTVVRDVYSDQWPPTRWALSTKIVGGVAVLLAVLGILRWIIFLY